ncbi:hypothetical protein, partial [Paraburkholderia sp. SIMBA_053]|uniref:hypothetical protein n=1 Tax=Paraburkholderia sp. SIMBA_053 TaxID=3085794 RepID=UPI003979B3CA
RALCALPECPSRSLLGLGLVSRRLTRCRRLTELLGRSLLNLTTVVAHLDLARIVRGRVLEALISAAVGESLGLDLGGLRVARSA